MPRDTSRTEVVHQTAGAARRLRFLRAAGVAMTFGVGPLAALTAGLILTMGPLETVAVLLLISGWIGPKMMGVLDI